MPPIIYNVFVHRAQDSAVKRRRLVILPAELSRVETNKWRLVWSDKQWLFTDQDVRLLIVGGSIPTTEHGRLTLLVSAAEGCNLNEYFRALSQGMAA